MTAVKSHAKRQSAIIITTNPFPLFI